MGFRLGTAPSHGVEFRVDNCYNMSMHRAQCYPYYGLLLGGGTTQGSGWRA